MYSVSEYYDFLVEDNNDPVRDPVPLQVYMDKWDGEVFIDALQLSEDKTVLEIGVGTGRLALKVCGKCKHFTGIDLSPKTIERTKVNLKMFDNALFICEDFLDYEFELGFDVVYSSLTFMHIKEKQQAIHKITQLLNTKGRFVLSIDKNPSNQIDYGIHKLTVYPDSPRAILAFLKAEELTIEKQLETEFADIFICSKC